MFSKPIIYFQISKSFTFKLINKFQSPSLLFEDSSDTLSTFQQNIQNEAILFANNNIRPNSIYLDKNFIYPKEIFNQAGKLSYGGVCGLKDYGGKESGKIGASIIFAELAEADIGLSAYISIHNMTGIVLEKYGTEELKKTYLKKLFSMESVSSYCLTEPNSGSDAISIKTQAILDQNDYVINGIKSLVLGAGENNIFLVFCLTGEKEISAFLVENNNKGISFSNPHPKMGLNAIPIRDVIFNNCRVPISNMIGKKGEGFKIAMNVLEAERLNIASCALGGATHCLKETITYLKKATKNRKNEQTHYKIAELTSKLLACKLLIRQAARSMDQNERKSFLYSARTKAFVPLETFEIIDECLQIYQEKKIMNDCFIEKYFRDVRALQLAGGTVEIMKHSVQRELLRK